MLESQIDLNDNRKKQLGRLFELMPDLSKQVVEAYKDPIICNPGPYSRVGYNPVLA